MGANTATVQKLYVAFFNRPGDALGQAFWEGKMDAGMTEAQVAASFAQSTEYTSVYGNLTTAATVSTLYSNLFGRSAAASEITFWGLRLLNGQETVASIARTLANSAQGTDATAIANKISAATSFTNGLTTTAQIVGYSGSAANAVAKAWLATVTDVATTLTAANSSLATTIANATTAGTTSAGTTFTLTSGVDNLTGTSGNDTFIADNTGTNKQLSVADQINGGDGTDTLKIYLAAADTATGQPTLTSIENVYINGGAVTAYTAATGTTGLTIDAAVQPAATTYTLAGQTLTLQNLKPGQATTTTIASSTDTVENVTLNGVVTGTTGTWTQTIDLSGAKQATLNVTATGANSTITLTNSGTALTTLNISGDKSLTLTESLSGLKTINASAATGAVSVDKSGVAAVAGFTFTGGSGNDTLKLKAGDLALLTSGAQLDGGAGTADKLGILDTSLASTDYAKINATKGFEVLGLNAAITVDASQLTSINQFSIDTGSLTQTISNLASGNVTTITASPTSLTLGVAVGVNTETINLGTSTSAGLTAATLVTTGATNVNLSSNGTALNTITTLTNSDNTNLVITGSADLTITNALSGSTTGSKVDASAFTGKLSVIGTNKGDVLIGGSGADTLTVGSSNVTATTLTGGAGADTFVDAAGVYGTGKIVDTITDFVVGTDKLTLKNQGTPVWTKTAVNVSSATTLAGAIAIADQFDGSTNGQIKWFTFGGNTYVVESNDTAANNTTNASAADIVVKLVGTLDLSSLNLTTATIA